jgi:predicted phage terminase large subunit-like protein
VTSIDVPGAPLNEDDEDTEEFYPVTIAPARHHRLVCEVLQRVADGHLRRVMIFMPPGSAKSTYASVCFPPWFMGRKKRSNIITLSYAADLARKFGRRCRSIAKSPEFRDIFGTGLSKDATAADEWNLGNGSTYMTNGLIAGVTGNRADGLIIDDPVRGIKDADSEAFQKATYEAYIFDARTRVKGMGWQIIIQTRWNPNDLAGKLLPEDYKGQTGVITCRDGHDWFVLNLPYEAEHDDDPIGRRPGDLLWTEAGSILNPNDILPIKLSTDPVQMRTWAALYQQRPTLGSGSYFLEEWFRYYDELPQHLTFYGASDYAVSDQSGDFTVHGAVGVDADDNIYVADFWRGQKDPSVTVDAFLDIAEQRSPLAWGVDKDLIVKSLGPFINVRMRDRGVYVALDEMPLGRMNKEMRATSFRGRMAQGKVYFPRNSPWVADMKRRMLEFPVVQHDDEIDMLGLVGRLIDKMVGGRGPGVAAPANVAADYGFEDNAETSAWTTG